ncbi:glycosyltransferase family 4 protein [Sulfurovum sp. CS9]|uniref:glycosyltransferase family 4 protein n=1 Tax=Sulfurovum sp. CS9 TaxID=3391146 RepID=UPI0039EB8C38
MRILHFLTNIDTGGAEKFCVDICNTQTDISDNEIYICVLDSISENQPLAKMVSPKVTLISLNKEGGYSLKMFYKIYKILSKLKPDIIHFHSRDLIYASLSILIKRIPSVYTVHTMANKQFNKYFRSYMKFLFNTFPSFFTPVAISKSVRESVQKTYGKHLNAYIFNGSSELNLTHESDNVSREINLLKKDENTLVFVSVGRIAREKNTLLLVKAVNALLDNSKNVCLCIVGYDGRKDQNYINKCKKENRYPERIKFVGRKENIADYLYPADALCLTSNYEGLGIAALEAFSMGVPVLSTPSGGPSDIIVPGLNGYISKEITVESYIEVLNRFIEKPLKNREKIIEIYQDKYTMKRCALQYLALYRSRYEEQSDPE